MLLVNEDSLDATRDCYLRHPAKLALVVLNANSWTSAQKSGSKVKDLPTRQGCLSGGICRHYPSAVFSESLRFKRGVSPIKISGSSLIWWKVAIR